MPRDDIEPAPIPSVVHVMLGLASVVAAFALVEAHVALIAVVLVCVAYVSWSVGRMAGMLTGLVASMIELVRGDHAGSLVVVSIGLVTYMVVAAATAAVEAATRPKE